MIATPTQKPQYEKNGVRCSICFDAATTTCQYCDKPLCQDCKILERECVHYRWKNLRKKKEGAK